MDSEGFRNFLEKRKIDQATIEASIKTLEYFDDFLRKKGKNISKNHRDREISIQKIILEIRFFEPFV